MSGPVVVYIVSSANHGEQQGVEAVFSTLEAAREWATARLWPPGDRAYIQAWKLDAGNRYDAGNAPGLLDVE